MQISSSTFPLLDVVCENKRYSAAQSFLELHYKSEAPVVISSSRIVPSELHLLSLPSPQIDLISQSQKYLLRNYSETF